MSVEKNRLKDDAWRKWGPYVSARQWGTVREDYSVDGNVWGYTTHGSARSRAYRWGEEGIGGISDDQQLLCFAPAFWNKKDEHLKEIFFGVSGPEGNHGEDVKELYYYLDATPSHSYMKMLYKYPQQPFPYTQLLEESRRRTRQDPEFELIDSGIFDDDRYFDIFIEYAKGDAEDILVQITVHNRGHEAASINVLPTIWFRNTWSWGYESYMPSMFETGKGTLSVQHRKLGDYYLYCDGNPEVLFCNNETNTARVFDTPSKHKFFKDGINDFITQGAISVNSYKQGSKVAANYDLTIEGHASVSVRVRLTTKSLPVPFSDFDSIFSQRIQDADEFYEELQEKMTNVERMSIQRQSLAGMVWNKQFYYYNVQQWLEGDPVSPASPERRTKKARNSDWRHIKDYDIISMPDKWEFPWFAGWDLAFHCIALSLIDPAFAKEQLCLLTKDDYMHPNGQLPAYEWNFSDSNPPVQAWAAWRLYLADALANDGVRDTFFLESIFHRLLLNFTWWVNRKDQAGNNIFEGGFLGLDNIGVFDRNAKLPSGGYLEQADGTSWMAMFALNMLHMALELSKTNKVYVDLANKFFEHFLYIAGALEFLGEDGSGLWDDEDGFFYDQMHTPGNAPKRLKVRSLVGLIPLFAVETLNDNLLKRHPDFAARMQWFLDNRPDLAALVSRFNEKKEKRLLSLLRADRMKHVLHRMLDENEFLSEFGIRSVSKYHLDNPYSLSFDDQTFSIKYTPGESDNDMFGGNSNWRGPIWFPLNGLIIESLYRFHNYYGDTFKVEHPTGSGNYLTLEQIADDLCVRLEKLYIRDKDGCRAAMGDTKKQQFDTHFKDYLMFYEYFHGDSGKGLGASHQTGWTGLIAKLLEPRTTRSEARENGQNGAIAATNTGAATGKLASPVESNG